MSGADARFSLEPPPTPRTPDQAFDRSWAHGRIAVAIAELGADCEKSGRGALFAILAPLVWGNPSAESLAQQGARLGQKEQTFTVAVHRLRAAIAETVAAGTDIDAELRHLIAAVGGGKH